MHVMRKFILLSFIVMAIVSCSKNNSTPDPIVPNQSEDSTRNEDSIITALKAHVWLFDSIERFQNAVVIDSLIESSPKIEMWYTDNKLYFNIPGGVQNDEYNYEVKDGNKLYRWREGSSLKNEYLIIQQLTDKLLVVSTHDEAYQDYEYYSPKQ
jgi:hypothetical protein